MYCGNWCAVRAATVVAFNVYQTVHDAVDGMEERPAVYLQAAAAKLPVGAQEEVKLEDLVLRGIQIAAGEQGEVGDEFFIFAAP